MHQIAGVPKQRRCVLCLEREKKVLVDGKPRRHVEYRKSVAQPTTGCAVCGVHVCWKCWPTYRHDMSCERQVHYDQ